MKTFKNIIQAFILTLSLTTATSAQNVSTLINEVSDSNLDQMLNAFSGEVTTTVRGNTVTILNRVSQSGNDLAADYLEEKLNSFSNLDVVSDQYSGGSFGGRNIIATQIGLTNPDDVYVISAHYDAVTNYCANDNATGTAAVLEVARILSKYCTENTIIYAFWDEEELGLVGSKNWADRASANGKNILGVINLDMVGYDKDGNNDIPIHTNSNSVSLKDDVVAILNTHSAAIGLTPNVINPGISASDHASFWNNGIKAIVLSDGATFNDLTPFFHTANDRVNTLHLPYFHKISRLLLSITATKAELINDNSCILSLENKELPNVSIYPNPTTSFLTIELHNLSNSATMQLTNIMGQILYEQVIESKNMTLSTDELPDGVYFLKINSDAKSIIKKIIKD